MKHAHDKNIVRYNNVYTVCCLAFLSLTSPLLSSAWASDASTLSIEETVRLARSRTFHSDKHIDKRRRSNPDARDRLYEILKDSSQNRDWPAITGFFMWIGDDEDVDKLINRFKTKKRLLTPIESTCVTKTFQALGGMSGRGVGRATETLIKMMDPDYWKDVEFTLGYEDNPTFPSKENLLSAKALIGYSWSLDPKLSEKATVLLDSIKDPEQKRLTKILVDKAIEFNKNLIRGHPKMYDNALISNQDHGKDHGKSDVEGDDISKTIDEAIELYKKLRDSFIERDLESVLPRLADDGKPYISPFHGEWNYTIVPAK